MSCGAPLDWQRLAFAFVHPIKIAVLELMQDEEPHAPSDLAVALDESLGGIAYHVKELENAGLIELVALEKKGRGIRRLYRLSAPGR